jgi:hypothetical protein
MKSNGESGNNEGLVHGRTKGELGGLEIQLRI